MTVLESFFGQPLCQRLGWMLVHFLWQGALLALLLSVVLLVLRRQSARLRYLVACVVLFAMAGCPLLTFALLLEFPAPGQVEPVTAVSVAQPVVLADSVKVQPQPTIPPAPVFAGPVTVPGPESTAQSLPVQSSPAKQTPANTSPAEPAPPDAVAPEPAEFSPLVSQLLSWTVAGWLVGVLLLAARLLGGWIWVQRLRARHTHTVVDVRAGLFQDLCRRLGQARPVRLLESALVHVPAVVGWLRPVVLLPVSAATGLSPGQWEALLAHELAHIRRHDYLVNLLQSVVETLLFYHPAVWWVSRQVRVERENCCDDVAVSLCQDRLLYARALTRLEELQHLSRMPAAAGVAADGGSLMSRIRRLLEVPAAPEKCSLRWLAGLLTLALLFVGGVAGFLFHQPAPLEAAPQVEGTGAKKETPKEQPAVKDWGATVKGLRLGLRLHRQEFAPGAAISVDVLIQNVGQEPITILNHHYNIYDFYPHTHFEVTNPDGEKVILRKPVGKMQESDFPNPRKLAAGEIYNHAVDLNSWQAARPGEPNKDVFLRPGTYHVTAVYQLVNLRGWPNWTGTLRSNVLTVKVSGKQPPAEGAGLWDQIPAADRIVVADVDVRDQPPRLRFLQTLKGGTAPGSWGKFDLRELEKPLIQQPPRKWVLFLKSVEEGDRQPQLAPIGKDWYRPYSLVLGEQIRAHLPLPREWSKEDRGLKLGLVPLQKAYVAGEDVRIEVAIKNVSAKTVTIDELRFNIYDYWEHTTFEVIGPDGKRRTLAKPQGPIKEDDMPRQRTLEPGAVYMHTVRLNRWPVEDEKAPRLLSVPGVYKVKCYNNMIRKTGEDKRWYSDLVSPEVTVTISAPANGPPQVSEKTKKAVAHLKKNLNQLVLQIAPHGPNLGPEPLKHLTLDRHGPPDIRLPENILWVVIDEAQALKLIDHLAAEGFFDRARTAQKLPLPANPKELAYTFVVQAAGDDRLYYEEAKLGPALNQRLLALGNAVRRPEFKVSEEFAALMGMLREADALDRTVKAVQTFRAEPKRFSLLIRYHGPVKAEERSIWFVGTLVPNIHLRTHIVQSLKPEQAEAIVSFLARDGYLGRAEMVRPVDLTNVNHDGVSLEVNGLDTAKILYEPLGQGPGLKKLDELAKLLKGEAGAAMADYLTDIAPLRRQWQERSDTIHKTIQTLKANPEKFALLLRLQHKDQHLAPSLWLLGGPEPAGRQPKFPCRVVANLSKQQVTDIVDRLAVEGFFEETVMLGPVPASPAPPYLEVAGAGRPLRLALGDTRRAAAQLTSLRYIENGAATRAIDDIVDKLGMPGLVPVTQQAAPPPAQQPKVPPVPLTIKIALDKAVHQIGEPIALTVTYTNTSREPLELLANGLTTGQGFAGEEYRIVMGDGKWVFRFEAIDPAIQRVKIEPGRSWTRTWKNLGGDLITAQHRDLNGLRVADGPFAFLPFQEPGLHTITLHYTSTVKNQPKSVFAGKLQSNSVELTLVPPPKKDNLVAPRLDSVPGALKALRDGVDDFSVRIDYPPPRLSTPR